MYKLLLQKNVISAAMALSKSAIKLSDGNAVFSSELSDRLGEALFALAEFEKQQYYQHFIYSSQEGLNTAQVSLQRATMPQDQLNLERLIDVADRLYLAVFDEVIVPNYWYRSKPSTHNHMSYVAIEEITKFLDLLECNE